MPTLSSRRHRGDGGPLVESLRDPRDLRAEVTPGSYRSYEKKHPDDIERPGRGASDGWEQLASALAKFNPALDRMAASKNARLVEEYAARGKEEMDRSKLDWKTFLEQNPEYQGVSPHFIRGYKSAELNSLAQLHQAALQDFFTTNFLANEPDPEKVRKATSEFSKTWTQQNVKYGDYDSDIYVDNYLKPAQQAEGAILSRHASNRANEHVKLGLETLGQNIVTSVDSVFDSTPNISNPDVMNTALDDLAQRTMGHMAEMEASGLTKSQATDVVMDSILNLAKGEGYEGYGKELLSLADKIKTGSGTIAGRPEFRAKVKDMLKGWENEQRQKRFENLQLRNEQRREAELNAKVDIGKALRDAYVNKQELPTPEELMSLPNVKDEHILLVNQVRGAFYGAISNTPRNDAQSQTEYLEDYNRARLGELSTADAMLLAPKYGTERAMQLYATAEAAHGEDSPVNRAYKSFAFQEGRKLLAAQVKALIDPMGNKPAETINARVAEAEQRLIDDVAKYVTENKGQYTSSDLRDCVNKLSLEIGKDPAIRDFETLRNIRLPGEEAPQPAPLPVKKQLGSNVQMRDFLLLMDTSPEKAEQFVKSNFGHEGEAFREFVATQSKAYKVNENVLKDLLSTYRMAAETKKRRSTFIMGHHPDLTTQTEHNYGGLFGQ